MKKDILRERLDKLLDATLLSYCETINLVDIHSLCDAMFKHLVEGDLNREFLCPKLDNTTWEDREKALNIANKYAYLCFYEGNVDYWEDSIDGYNPGIFPELISESILDNYNFLVELAHEKGEAAVSELANLMQISDEESSVVDYARNSFGNDQALKEVLSFTSEDTKLNSKTKAILYRYPEGILFKEYEDDYTRNFIIVPKIELLSKIAIYAMDGNINTMNNLQDVSDYLGQDLFEIIIRDIHLEYLSEKKKTNYK